jgi:Kef-type K+ transport system membrane component KefB/Ca2+-binding EF-hand superfamily protein
MCTCAIKFNKLGPPLANYVPYSEALVLIGEIGLIFLIIEAGIELDVQQLRQTGTRAMSIAVVGCLLPICAAFAVVLLVDEDADFKSALAVGFSFAPTSLGVASSALSSGDVSDTPVGQLIMAACVLSDIIGLVLLSMFQVLVKDDPKLIEYFTPLLSSFGFLIVCGLAAIYFLSDWIEQKILPMIPKKHRDVAMFVGAFAMCMGYLPMMYYTKASYLAGAFLVGFTFSLVEGAHEKFVSSTHSIMEWLLKIFFAATIGFQVPVKLLFEREVLTLGLLFWVTCVLIKLLVAFFVPNFGGSNDAFNPYKRDLLTTGLSMTCRGELNFIIAAFALDKDVIDPKMYASIVFAVLLSAITSPYVLLKSLNYFNGLQEKYLKNTNPMMITDATMPLHFHIYIETKNAWSLSDRLQTEFGSKLGLAIEDYRTGHNRNRVNPIVHSNIYVRDPQCRVHVPTVNEQKELLRLEPYVLNRSAGYEHLWDSKQDDSLSRDQKEELELITTKTKENEMVLARQNEIEKALRRDLHDLEIESVTVTQWEPWDWNHILDTLSLNRPNGSDVTFDFLMNMFEVADVDESGELDGDEFCRALQNGGINLSREGLTALVSIVDANSDGNISREEWKQAIALYLERKQRKVLSIRKGEQFENDV